MPRARVINLKLTKGIMTMSDKKNKVDNGMSKWSWVLVGAILLFTVGGTWELTALTSTMGGIALLARQSAAVLFSDGALLYWHFHKDKYPTAKQRQWAKGMMWESLALVLVFTIAYMLLSVMGDAWTGNVITVRLAGHPFAASVTEWLDVLVLFGLGLQAAGTLSVVLYIASLSPHAQMTLRQREAEQEVTERQLSDYETAQKTIAPIVGQAQAIAALREQLTALDYNEREREKLVNLALSQIQASRADGNGTPSASTGTLIQPVPLRTDGLTALAEVGQPVPFRSNGNGHKN